MLLVDPMIKAAASGVAFVFALIVLLGDPRRATNRWLATFLFLIAGNQAFEMQRWLATDPGTATVWFRLATICAALDPLALYMFAASYPSANRLRDPYRVVPVVAAAGVLTLAAGWLFVHDEVQPTRLWDLALLLYTAITYTIVLVHALGVAPRTASTHLVVAATIAALPVWSAWGAGVAYFNAPSDGRAHVIGLAARVTAVAIAIAALALVARRAPRPHQTAFVLGVGVTLAYIFLLQEHVLFLLPLGWPNHTEVVPFMHTLGRAGAGLRLTLFGLLLSVVVLRDDAFGLNLRARRRAARAVVAMAFALVSGGIVLAFAAPSTFVRPIDVLLLAGVVGLSQGFRRLIDRVAWLAYGVPLPENSRARVEAYRVAARQALAEGPEGAQRLASVRTDLEIEPAVARAIEVAEEANLSARIAPGTRVAGRYRIVRLLAQGAHGQVFLARDERLARDVAIKELPLTEGASSAVDEARVAGQLNHPNVVTVHDVVRTTTSCLVVTEHAAGGTLADRTRDRPLARAQAVRWLTDVLEGLAHVHARGVVHRDVKPSNVLIDAQGRAKIGDFGIARMGREDATRIPGVVIGTPAFMAPEQQRGEVATAASDVYSFGLLARRLAPQGLPGALEEIVGRALAPEPSARWRDAGEMLDAWREHLGPESESAASDADHVSVG